MPMCCRKLRRGRPDSKLGETNSRKFSRRHWWLYVVIFIGSGLVFARLEDTANRELDKVAGPVLKEIGVLVSELILSPLLLPALLVCVLLIISFIRTMVMPLPPEVLTPQPIASKSRQ